MEQASHVQPAQAKVPLIRYILQAEFDIDKGSIVRHQVPGPTGIPEGFLAESMLPEGGHLHETDWTIFFLRPEVKQEARPLDQKLGESNEAIRILPLQQQCQIEVCEYSWEVACYVMNPADAQYNPLLSNSDLVVVRFRVAKTATQMTAPEYTLDVEGTDGVILRSIAVTGDLRYAFRDEDRFAVVNFDSECVCSLSLQFQTQDDILRFESIICKVLDSTSGNVYAWEAANDAAQDVLLDPELEQRFSQLKEVDQSMLICINLVHTKKIQSVRRGAVVKALTFVTSRRFVDMFRPLMVKALDEIFSMSDESSVLSFLRNLFETMNDASCPTVQATALHSRVVRGLCGFGQTCPTTSFDVTLCGETFNLRMPIVHVFEEELGGVSVMELVRTFGESVMFLYNSVFLGRRILFLGHNLAASLVSRFVLAAAALVRPMSAGILQRLFPYAHLTDLTFLRTPGFIAGVTNPIFANHWEWFDVLADMKQGTVQVKSGQPSQSSSAGATSTSPNISSNAEKAADSVNASHENIDGEVYAQITCGGLYLFGENFTRAVFQDHTISLLDQVASKELFRDDCRRRLTFDANASRLAEYRTSKHHEFHDVYQKFFQRHSLFGRHLSTLKTSVRLLQVRKLPPRQIQSILEELTARLSTEEHVWQFLDLVPECRSGLLPIATCLFGDQQVQKAAVELLELIEPTGVGSRALDQLPVMMLLAYRRLKRGKKTLQPLDPLQQFCDTVPVLRTFDRLPNRQSGSVSDPSPSHCYRGFSDAAAWKGAPNYDSNYKGTQIDLKICSPSHESDAVILQKRESASKISVDDNRESGATNGLVESSDDEVFSNQSILNLETNFTIDEYNFNNIDTVNDD